ncbi:cupredoxin domain-containing protein [Pseudarthrobacter sp. H2]|uniref:cupredoxin domain-containing protein n=1 Tax=Pseudarthrobacter sp. H2 TaxID=3418415 RepID=UPI003CEC76C3
MTTTTKRHSLRLILLAGAAALALSACGSTGAGAGSSPATASVTASRPAAAGPGSTHSMDPGMGASSMGAGSTGTAAMATIHIKSFAYTGPDSVPAGATVTVMNMDSEAHTVTADDGSFDAVVKAGTSVTFTAPKKPGAYDYHCTYHSNMHGTLTVK